MLWWNDDLATGIESIDNQHKRIFEMADKILFFDEKTSKTEIIDALDFLTSYVIEHFALEEGYMIKNLYADFHDHRQRHTNLIYNLYEINTKFIKNGLSRDLIEDFKILILQWLVNHIDSDDKKFSNYIRNKN